MPNLARYPRGYVTLGVGTAQDNVPAYKKSEESDGHKTIEELYKQYIGRQVNSSSWENFRSKVVIEAVKTFGDFHRWLYFQAVHNDHIYDVNFDFIVDTLQFIRTGKRDAGVLVWKELLLEHPEVRPGVANLKRADAFKINDAKEFSNVIGMWCSQPNGFEDMLCTVHVLYGVSKQPLATPVYKFN